jgi:hypothetical protein
VVIEPGLSHAGDTAYQRFEASAVLRSQDAGASEIEMGVGVAVIVERTQTSELDLAALGGHAILRFDDAELTFAARPRDENVRV